MNINAEDTKKDDVFEIPSLQKLSVQAVIASRNCERVVQMYDFSNNAGLHEAYIEARRFIQDKFAFFLERYGESEMKKFLTAEDFAFMHKRHIDRLQIEARLRHKGSVVEREVVPFSDFDTEEGYYPLKCLIQGVAWPEGVDPSKRELYLSPAEFEKTFGMKKEEFQKLDKIMRVRIKKDKGLF